jgi:hypothetical protein
LLPACAQVIITIFSSSGNALAIDFNGDAPVAAQVPAWPRSRAAALDSEMSALFGSVVGCTADSVGRADSPIHQVSHHALLRVLEVVAMVEPGFVATKATS